MTKDEVAASKLDLGRKGQGQSSLLTQEVANACRLMPVRVSCVVTGGSNFERKLYKE